MKKIISLGLAFLFVLLGTSSVSAVNYKAEASPTPMAEVNSFELFWPLAPGKTMSDPLYMLKTLKEDLRGFTIFGKAQKADYLTFIATKRYLEAEQLLKEGKTDLANKTLDKGLAKVNSGLESYKISKADSTLPATVKDNISKSLGNLEIFIKYLSIKYEGDARAKLIDGLNKVSEFQNSL